MNLPPRRAFRLPGGSFAVRLVSTVFIWACVGAAGRGDPPTASGLRIAFSSLRDRPAFASLYVYEHDGVSSGRILRQAPAANDTSFTNSLLAENGSQCLCVAKQVGGFAPQFRWFDIGKGEFIASAEGPNEIPSVTHVRLSRQGDLLAFCVWEQPGLAGGWDIRLRERRTGRWLDTTALNTSGDERDVALSGNGEKIAFVAVRPDGAGLSDIYVFDRTLGKLVPTPGLNTAYRELNPCWDDAGTTLAFVSDRPGGAGGLDVYTYSLGTCRVTPHPTLNSAGHEQSPSLSRSGRYVVFVSERSTGSGDRDLFLADLTSDKLLTTPELNSPAEDFDPCLEGP